MIKKSIVARRYVFKRALILWSQQEYYIKKKGCTARRTGGRQIHKKLTNVQAGFRQKDVKQHPTIVWYDGAVKLSSR